MESRRKKNDDVRIVCVNNGSLFEITLYAACILKHADIYCLFLCFLFCLHGMLSSFNQNSVLYGTDELRFGRFEVFDSRTDSSRSKETSRTSGFVFLVLFLFSFF